MPDAETKSLSLVSLLDRAWTELTAPGAPFELAPMAAGSDLKVYRHAPSRFDDIWSTTRTLADRDYLIFEGERWSYGTAHRIVDAVAAWLCLRGVEPGDRIAIAMRNYPEWMLIFWAAARVGAVIVGMNGWWTAEEAANGLADTSPRVVFCDQERHERLRSVLAIDGVDLVVIRSATSEGCFAWKEIVETDPAGFVAPSVSPDDVALIYFTSGTTGRAKGAQLTHRGCINTMMSIEFNAAVVARVEAWRRGGEVSQAPAPPPVAMAPTPLFHVTANPCLTFPITRAGGTLVLLRKWDLEKAATLIEREHVNIIYAVPTQVRELARVSRNGTHDLTSLAVLSGGGASMQPELVQQVDSLELPVVASTGYGMTETCGAVTTLSGALYAAFPHTVGRATPTTQARIVDADGRDVEAGGRGELLIRGVSVIRGYINAPEASAATIVDGWLRTGDVARIDANGFIEIVDRIKDVIIRGGENIYCAEVEAALYRIEGVAEACAFGITDGHFGEEVGAAIAFAPGAPERTADAVRAALAAMIARHKIPRYLWTLPAPLPHNASGKILRRELQSTLSLDYAQ